MVIGTFNGSVVLKQNVVILTCRLQIVVVHFGVRVVWRFNCPDIRTIQWNTPMIVVPRPGWVPKPPKLCENDAQRRSKAYKEKCSVALVNFIV